MNVAATAYHVLDQDLWSDPGPALGEISPPVDILDLLRGRKLAPCAEPLRIRLLPSSSLVLPDLLSYLLPLVTDALRRVLERAGVDNVDYRQADLFDSRGRRVGSYSLANVLGLVRCVDLGSSDAKPWLGKTESRDLGSFTIDAARADGARMFRLAESSQLLLVDGELADALASARLRGLRLRSTGSYDGY